LISSIIFPTNETTTAATSLEILPEKDKGKAQISFLVAYMTELFTYRMIMVIIIVLRKKKRKRKGEKAIRIIHLAGEHHRIQPKWGEQRASPVSILHPIHGSKS
jgi:hypothetical protein